MKLLLNLGRSVIFAAAIFLLLVLIFYCFDWGGARAIIFIGEVREKINPFLFWALFILFGIAILYILWFLFKYITMTILVRLVRVCPYRNFAIWVTGIMAFAYMCYFLYRYWFLGRIHFHIHDTIFGIILAAASIQTCFLLVYGVIVSYEIEEKDNLEAAKST
jgi:hypothetical protein